MKISRGMFESAVMAEYLRQNPAEVEDYIQYRHVIWWKRLKYFPDDVQPEKVKEIEENYNRVKARFSGKKGGIRGQWHKPSIADMSKSLGREMQYELPYSIAASMHHGNWEAMSSRIDIKPDDVLDIDEPPSMAWVDHALLGAHIYYLQALDALNDTFSLAFDNEIKAADGELTRVWKRKP